MQPTPTAQNTYNPTDEMKRLLAIVKQQSTYSDIASHIQQLELLASAIRGQLSALREKQSAETNKTYSTTAVAQKRLKPKGKAVPKPKPKPQPQQQKQQPKAVANVQQPNADFNSAVDLVKQMKQELEHPNYPKPNPLPNRTTPYKTY